MMACDLETSGNQKVKVYCFPPGHSDKFLSHLEKQELENRYNVLHHLGWDAHFDHKKKIETDQYDIAPTVKFVCVAPYTEKFLGSVRLMPMKYHSMIRDAFSNASKPERNLVDPGFQLPADAMSAELTRLVVRRQFLKPKPQSHRSDKFKQARKEVVARLYVAVLAYCHHPELRPDIPGLNPEDNVEVEKIFAISYVDAWEPVFAKRGLEPEFIGDAKWVTTTEEQDPLKEVLEEHIQAGYMEAKWEVAKKLYKDYGLEGPAFYTTRPPRNGRQSEHQPCVGM
jgi:N-acyl-L-homoserine lactone synthetase